MSPDVASMSNVTDGLATSVGDAAASRVEASTAVHDVLLCEPEFPTKFCCLEEAPFHASVPFLGIPGSPSSNHEHDAVSVHNRHAGPAQKLQHAVKKD